MHLQLLLLWERCFTMKAIEGGGAPPPLGSNGTFRALQALPALRCYYAGTTISYIFAGGWTEERGQLKNVYSLGRCWSFCVHFDLPKLNETPAGRYIFTHNNNGEAAEVLFTTMESFTITSCCCRDNTAPRASLSPITVQSNLKMADGGSSTSIGL